MEYVHVEGNTTREPDERSYSLSAIRQSKNCLISLISGLRQKNFGFDTIFETAEGIKEFSNSIDSFYRFKLFIDSGGYSIIKGDVDSSKIPHFIECYSEYARNYRNHYDYIFSLDIPYFGNEPEVNTVKDIERFNTLSNQEMLRNFVYHPEVQDKTFFVWHFKMPSQYLIWDILYTEMGLRNAIKKRAIGGMVALREKLKNGGVQLGCSPFTHIAYRQICDHLDSPFNSTDFYLHFLGINLLQDRFQIELLEQLFSSYLKRGSKAILTYDSINYTYQAIKRARDFYLIHRNGDSIHVYKEIAEIPNSVVDEVYFTYDIKMRFLQEIENLINGKEFDEGTPFIPLSVYNQRKIDVYFSDMISKYELVNLITKSPSHNRFLYDLKKILTEIQSNSPDLFSENLIDNIYDNCSRTFDLHSTFLKDNRESRIHRKVMNFIEEMAFPSDLKR